MGGSPGARSLAVAAIISLGMTLNELQSIGFRSLQRWTGEWNGQYFAHGLEIFA